MSRVRTGAREPAAHGVAGVQWVTNDDAQRSTTYVGLATCVG
ncbi:hypothetical protein SGM_1578 [Streptomyces griseoaurantiacus M045]|uniref:Uncharacterized protein n=1 Tax=Streptomyces griseoaurantiacus M045 TaxID=996637 RepID=F3NEL4_9ACTN|nr:hypothetical protein SGM_1578 [Streptomyces griseoaurantiacus M045]